jgi:hypothetical protein
MEIQPLSYTRSTSRPKYIRAVITWALWVGLDANRLSLQPQNLWVGGLVVFSLLNCCRHCRYFRLRFVNSSCQLQALCYLAATFGIDFWFPLPSQGQPPIPWMHGLRILGSYSSRQPSRRGRPGFPGDPSFCCIMMFRTVQTSDTDTDTDTIPWW